MQIVGVDPNPEMASYAVQAAQDADLPKQALRLLNGAAEQLPVPSTSQDAVVCTLVSASLTHTFSCCSALLLAAHTVSNLMIASVCEPVLQL